MNINLKPRTPESRPDSEAVFSAKDCSVARGCWCKFYRDSRKAIPAAGASLRDERGRCMKELTSAWPQPSASIHAWCCSCRRSAFATLTRRWASFVEPAMPDIRFKSRRSASAA
jgi:hypothetical protein